MVVSIGILLPNLAITRIALIAFFVLLSASLTNFYAWSWPLPYRLKGIFRALLFSVEMPFRQFTIQYFS